MILVTGHRGFVGSHLVAALAKRSPRWGRGIDLKEGDDIIECDLPDTYHIEKVYHLAAQTDAYCTDTILDMKTNIEGTLRLLDRYASKVVFASSSMVNYLETPYAISKQAGEHYARMYGAAIVRFCNLYGPGGHSVIDRFEREDPITIYGDGSQRRTYAPVSAAVTALLTAKPGSMAILKGYDATVNDLANRTGKARVYKPARMFDLVNAIQEW